jgi:hypothetical protein
MYSLASRLGISRAGPDVITMAPRALLDMIETIINASKSDARLVELLDEAREYAQVYLLAKERKKGCEGTGELMTLREEFRDVLGKLGRYCGEQGYQCDISPDDPDKAVRTLLSETVRGHYGER